MKKLLLIALLMLALVITAVACNDDPVEPGTSGDEVTTVETPTEAPTDEPSTPAPETDPETDAETEAPKKGCGSSVALGSAVILMAMAAAVALKKKD